MSERQKPAEEVGSWLPTPQQQGPLPVEVEALQVAIATLLPEVAALALMLERLPRSRWREVCAAIAAEKRRSES